MFRCSGIQNIKWYKWDGSYECCNVMEIMLKHNVYDAFHNVSIRCWNRTKFACNTNLMLLMPGPYSQYIFKYSHKGTQKEDSQIYDKDEKKHIPLDLTHIEEYFLLHLLIKITMLLEQQWLLCSFEKNKVCIFT